MSTTLIPPTFYLVKPRGRAVRVRELGRRIRARGFGGPPNGWGPNAVDV